MIISAQTLRKLKPVSPFVERGICYGMSYGLSVAGYDIRLRDGIHLLPLGFSLASSLESFTMPANVLGVVHDKSTWARQGLAVQNTVLEPGWRGFLTLELTNHSEKALKILAGSPIAQIVFHFVDEPVESLYQGKYQDQDDRPVPAIFESTIL